MPEKNLILFLSRGAKLKGSFQNPSIDRVNMHLTENFTK